MSGTERQPREISEQTGAGNSGRGARAAETGQLVVPSLSLPKGGGAIRGIGEKFSVNPATGTGSLSVPILTSPGRSGVGPQLSLSYDSGAGNGPFGFGWSLSLPSITRKTDKGLPRYLEAEESDVFILSGAEDLVPVLVNKNGRWEEETLPAHTRPGGTYTVRRYRPRTEGLFARIERWTNKTNPQDTFWRSISKDNITTWYGKTADSRIADPDNGAHIFSWLICESYDDKGNAILYEYVTEDSREVDTSQANEANRTAEGRAANRYLKRIRYGNRRPRQPDEELSLLQDWHFEVVFDYAEGHYEELPFDPTKPEAEQHRKARVSGQVMPGRQGLLPWPVRPDPFSTYRAGFEVRTYRRCHRVLMFHRFDELGSEPYLVRATEFDYADFDYSGSNGIEAELAHQGSTRFASFIRSVTQSGFVRDDSQAVLERNGVKYLTYLKKSLPPLEFEYSKAKVQDDIQELDADSLENLPIGLDGATYQWVDLEGEGVSGVLTEQAGAWYYKPNLGEGRFGFQREIAAKPSLASLSGGRQQLLDLAGDGQLDLVVLSGPAPGFYERTQEEGWELFRTFDQLPNFRWEDPNLRFVDLNGDGHADVLITEHEVFTWHPSLAEQGFGPARQVHQPRDEEQGPRLVLADGTQSVYLADMCGDGLTDLVRIRNGEVCYWPNLGYGRFGAKVTLDNAPWFDHPDQFSQQRIRLTDIDGSGASDIVYLGRDGVRLYFNQSGNRWSEPRYLRPFPPVDNLSSIMTADLLGNGTACLIWSSPLPAEARRPMRYLDLMGGTKPHLLTSVKNNLGAETRLHYAASTRFYLEDKAAGRPWITRLPFPVHVVDRVETYDYISRSRFVSCYTYHHGYFDGEEREFRGFGLVEQRDTEEFISLSAGGEFPAAANLDQAFYVPPVLTKTWFHTGAYLEGKRISRQFEDEYYREGDANRGESGLTEEQLRASLLEDTVLPGGLSCPEEREACRALKGSILRQEIYGLDGSDAADRPYRVSERNYTVKCLQPSATNRHAVFFTHPRETIDFHYERKLSDIGGKQRADPRISHTMNLAVDNFGNVERAAAINYRRREVPDLKEAEQENTHITFTVSRFANQADKTDWYRIGLPIETRTYELVKPPAPKIVDGLVELFSFGEIAAVTEGLLPAGEIAPSTAATWPYEKWDWRLNAANAPAVTKLRLIEQVRTLYRSETLTGLLPLGEVDSLALPGETYKLAFTADLLTDTYRRNGANLLPNDPTAVLQEGGYISGAEQYVAGLFPDNPAREHWWLPSGATFYHPDLHATAQQALAEAKQHFFLPRRFADPFGHSTRVDYAYDLLVSQTKDALDNVITAENDYRVLQPRLLTDPNRNRSEVAFDALGLVVATAAMGKQGENLGDSLENFEPDLIPAQIDSFCNAPNPRTIAPQLLGKASTRIVYDLNRYRNTAALAAPQPVFAATIARETHVSDLPPPPGQFSKLQVSFSYSDGFGREIQKKLPAEKGPLVEGGADISPRWVGSGWTIFNNKGKPVRQYEPFFTNTHRFEFDVRIGVSPTLFYDPVERVVATLHPNHAWEKVVFDPWRQETWEVNDTVTLDPRTDADVKGFLIDPDGVSRLPAADYLPTWYALRTDPAQASRCWPDQRTRDAEKAAAQKAALHEKTPTVAHFDSLGRTFLTLAHNGFKPDGTPLQYPTRGQFDIEGNQRTVIDALGRAVMRYDYDLLSNRIRQDSMDAGQRWMVNDVAGKPLRAWDSRGHTVRTEYDPLRRPQRIFVIGADPANPGRELLVERLVYGEQHPEDQLRRLRGRLYLHLDQAGAASNEEYDFKGNPKSSSRRLATEYKQAVDWRAVDATLPPDGTAQFNPIALEAALAPLLESETFTNLTTYDALNRPVTLATPHTPAMPPNIIRPGYNEANLLERVEVNLRGAAVATSFVTNIDYDAKGQRTRIDYGNNVRTTYEYDPLTLRLIHLLTVRGKQDSADCQPQLNPRTCEDPPTLCGRLATSKCVVQDLHYTYDPTGNITHLRDDSQPTVIFAGAVVTPEADYSYDALYRLIEAAGREHLGQTYGVANAPTPPDAVNGFHLRHDHPGVGKEMGRYEEEYLYDAVGNILSLRHRGSDPAQPGWKRCYQYAADSNRLLSTSNPGDPHNPNSDCPTHYAPAPFYAQRYAYDEHGNMTRLPHLGGVYPNPNMHWDYKDQLRQADLGGGGTAYYTYDAAGQRVRKVWEKAPGLTEERIYLGGFELFRRRNGSGAVTLERETLHVMDDKQRIALVETKTVDSAAPPDPSPDQLIRYQFGNHLGSSSLELDDRARLISYEEYYPYGSTSYQAVSKAINSAAKRYRYTGKERDEESGLYYHGARYYAPWLGRWISCDPAGISDGLNLLCFVKGNPVTYVDPKGTQSKEPEEPAAAMTYSHGKYGVSIDENGAIQVAKGDWLSKYSSAIHKGDVSQVFEYERLVNGEYVPVENPNEIVEGETLYHRPTRLSNNAASQADAATIELSPVEAFFDVKTGTLRLQSSGNKEIVEVQAESGGKPYGEPIPPGKYEILEQARREHFYRLDAIDRKPRNDVHEATGRTEFRLHRPGLTTGCIAVKDKSDWARVDAFLKQSQTESVKDDFHPPIYTPSGIKQRLGTDEEERTIRKFGTLTVYGP